MAGVAATATGARSAVFPVVFREPAEATAQAAGDASVPGQCSVRYRSSAGRWTLISCFPEIWFAIAGAHRDYSMLVPVSFDTLSENQDEENLR